jgi:tRNA threonylcarbamoyladenosine biosynthesis protein TsaB
MLAVDPRHTTSHQAAAAVFLAPKQGQQHPVLLAFDTSTELLAVGLTVGPHADASQSELLHLAPGGAAASAALLPAVHGLLAQAGLLMADVQAIAFGNGPGAFTGLRTACAVAQGLGWGLNVPLLPICSLLVVAEDCRGQLQANPHTPGQLGAVLDVAVAMDARMGEVYAAVYRWHAATDQQPAHWQTRLAPALLGLAALTQAWADVAGLPESTAAAVPVAVTGSALLAFGERLAAWPGPATTWPHEHNRAAALLRLARQAHAAGSGVAADQALPHYLRNNVAQTTAERLAAKLHASDVSTASSAGATV